MIARFILHRVRSRAWHHRFTLRWAQVCAAEAAGVGRRRLEGGSGAGGGGSGRGVEQPEAALRSLVRRALAAEDMASSGEVSGARMRRA